MGANVLVYAMKKGNASGVSKLKGANARVTSQQLSELGLFGTPAKTVKPGQPQPSVKVKKPPVKPGTKPNAPPDEPDEIDVIGDE